MAGTIRTAEFDEEGVRIQLIGSPDEVTEALRAINQEWKEPLSGWLRGYFPGLSSEDLADTWAKMLADLSAMVQKKKFDADKPLLPLLCTILKRRGTDLARRKEAHDKLLQEIAHRLKDTEVGRHWKQRSDSDRLMILEEIRYAVAKYCSPRQALVFDVWMNNLPESKCMETLRSLVSEVTGVEESLAAVKGAFQVARSKVRERLHDREIDLGF